jgi:hypothetical protein
MRRSSTSQSSGSSTSRSSGSSQSSRSNFAPCSVQAATPLLSEHRVDLFRCYYIDASIYSLYLSINLAIYQSNYLSLYLTFYLTLWSETPVGELEVWRGGGGERGVSEHASDGHLYRSTRRCAERRRAARTVDIIARISEPTLQVVVIFAFNLAFPYLSSHL